MARFFHQLKYDVPASIVVCFVAIPLCLGIALASNAPLFSGLISGIVGGVVVGIASGSALGVSGPAAGLVAVVSSSLLQLNSWETFLLAVVIAGIIQLISGFLGGGVIAYYFPSSVIKGMLAGIGIIIILKQIPLALGFNITNQDNMVIELANHMFTPFMSPNIVNLAPIIITIVSIFVLLVWEQLTKKMAIFQLIPGPLIVVLIGILFVWCNQHGIIPFKLDKNQLVNIPIPSNALDFFGQFHFPDFSQLSNVKVYKIAAIIALIASLETLLSVQATDRLDPNKRTTSTDRELKAQGLGNIICGLLGGLPVTQVIVRSTANITFGAKTKLSTILHGLLILLCVTMVSTLLNMIPLATLASILFVIGYKLTKSELYIQMYRLGWEQFVPFITTVVGVVFENLLIGISLGMVVSVFIILRHNYKNSHIIFMSEKSEQKIILRLSEQVSFLNKGSIVHELHDIPEEFDITIDASKTKIIDYDVTEAIYDFVAHAKTKNIKVTLIGDSLEHLNK